jgi:glycosyltransferase involved in cell wall biosynthesis
MAAAFLMRVLHVINSLILAGVEVLLSELVPRFQERGLENTVVILKPLDGPLEHKLRNAGTRVVWDGASGFYSPDHVFRLAKLCDGYDVVQSYLFPAQLWTPLALALRHSRVLLVTTEQSTYNRRRHWWGRPLDHWIYNHYRAIACNSQATLESLVAWVPSIRDRVRIIPNAVPLERFTHATPAARAEFGIPPDAPLISFVARFNAAKDHATLLRAVARLRAPAHLILVGDGGSRPATEAMAATLGISERVHFLGRRSDVPALLKMSDVYAHSSNWEGFGIAAVEAMAAGIPVVATNVPGLSQVIGSAGLLFPSGDDAALAQQLDSLLGSPELRQRFAAAGTARAQQFSMEQCADAYIEMYHEVIRSARKGDARPQYTSGA